MLCLDKRLQYKHISLLRVLYGTIKGMCINCLMNMFFYMDFSVEELRKKIILEPQWIIDALKSLITAETFIRQNPAITSKFREFVKTGKLTHELIGLYLFASQ